MAKVSTFTVIPRLPERLEKLREIAHNIYWCWDPEAIELLFRIDPDLWVQTNQNPIRILGETRQERLEALSRDESFLAQLDRVATRLEKYLAAPSWRDRHPTAPQDFNVAYLSAEFGVHESISIYSGGLGILAGDFLKSASDLGLPLVGVGLLYREGYHRQYLNADGWQQERYPPNDFYNMPVTLVRDESGKQTVIEIDYPQSVVKARLWRCQVGRVPLYLLDSDFEENEEDEREITARLYGGDQDMRVRQEIMLGMGGVIALHRLGIHPTIYHMNEGHSAFLTLQRIRDLMKNEKLSFEHAAESVRAASVFTTHTPVPAGNDMFPPELMHRYFSKFAQDLGVSMDTLLGLGRQEPRDGREPFCMTVLAIRLSAAVNGVSKLHGKVARGMWSRTWTGVPEDEIPVTSITNGVHTRFWVSRDLAGLYDRYLGPGWITSPSDPEMWSRIDTVPDAELWRTHERRRERLVTFARRRLSAQLQQRGAPNTEIRAASEVLDPEVLTIAFARRFATYKRANLFLMDPARLTRILTNKEQPVQLIIAGKAHPADNQGKDLIRRVIHFARQPEVRNHIIFIEDYDINVARYLVGGVDCWLNTPRRPLEASGTSGMKAAANGVLNISIPDGWWCEAEQLGENGWSIGRGEMYDNPDEQDNVESQALYEILEREVVPTYYDRGRDGIPRNWVARMKTAIKTICPVFNTQRMVQEYTDRFYLPATVRRNELRANARARSQSLVEWKSKVRKSWDKLSFKNIQCGPTEGLLFGTDLSVTVEIFLDELTQNDVLVELYYGSLDPHGRILQGKTVKMESCGKGSDKTYRFEGAIACEKTGQQGFSLRVVPSHPDLAYKHETGLITWA
ncbi:MAG: alpha-glucan family phosphorylase [Candidatus Hydrogenedentes bacterium]|nr:alpha-glucan family phosphorylase [Candidatus Hydrogenedentota bacterium]